ncbi:MAG: hypothetical protein LC624_10540, partial [Halobacteriales archaeon]|nr:hypothetical protein [Halobacteriales archaeon]
MARAVPATLLLLLLLPAAAGCIDFFAKRPPPPPDRADRLVKEVYLVPSLDLRVDSPYGYLHVNGTRVLAVPVKMNGTEGGAVYLGSTLAWRADEVFQVQQKENVRADMFVQAPVGSWAQVRAGQAWQPADASALAGHGLPTM